VRGDSPLGRLVRVGGLFCSGKDGDEFKKNVFTITFRISTKKQEVCNFVIENIFFDIETTQSNG
jgi:hypothetical protein